jgi:hypothetical protein
MPLSFSLNAVQHVEFGVGYEVDNQEYFALVPVDQSVQDALVEMAEATWEALQRFDPEEYQPSEKHSSSEYLLLPLDSDLAAWMRNLHTVANLRPDGRALEDPGALFCYFAKFTDARGRPLTAVRRASQFKGIVRKRLLQFLADTMKLVEDTTFRLDDEFDFLIDRTQIHVLHPSGLETLGELQEAVRAAVPENIAAIRRNIPFVEFESIAEYATGHTRAARLLASIRGQQETRNIAVRLLHNACETHNVRTQLGRDGRLTVVAGHEMEFLNILDRRMYVQQLVEGLPERYQAASRRRVGN